MAGKAGGAWIEVVQYTALVSRNNESYPISKYAWILLIQTHTLSCHIPKIL